MYLGNITVEDRYAWATFLDVAWITGYVRFVFFFYLSLINQKLVMKVVARQTQVLTRVQFGTLIYLYFIYYPLKMI